MSFVAFKAFMRVYKHPKNSLSDNLSDFNQKRDTRVLSVKYVFEV